ncbi:MAG: hypothetical protein EOP52_00870 [Sphingobacteriales bacterium]|nr:MAG: hypothetical protein EOP52_00870 [Sphingobacteriales bacterium]
MKIHFYLTALSLMAGFSGKAQSTNLEIGLTGGVHFHNHSDPYGLNALTKTGIDLQGSLLIRYTVSPKWKLGIEATAGKWTSRDQHNNFDFHQSNLLQPEGYTVHEASPMLAFRATGTRLLHAGLWQTALILKAGYALAVKKDLPLEGNGSYDFSLPSGSGFTASIQLEQSRMITKNLGAMAVVGFDYYRVNWGKQPTYVVDMKDNLISVPVSLGVFARF